MDREKCYKFKLLVPPKVSNGQINAVRPQEILESADDMLSTIQSLGRCHDKGQNRPCHNTSVVAPSKAIREDLFKMKAVSPFGNQENCNPGELYTKLFNEVDKIKIWKAKVETDTAQSERRNQDNQKTIETQRKAIQDLQTSNETLSIKLQKKISENEDLRNKNNATRNLCNILKETFQCSAEKMQLFETEREETHQLFVENNENMKKLIGAFESLQVRVEADQEEMQKLKDEYLKLMDVNQKYQQENMMKNEEIALCQKKITDKENELQKVMSALSEVQKHSDQLQTTTDQQFELLKNLELEKEYLLENLHSVENRFQETKESLSAVLENTKNEYEQIIQSKDLSVQELSTVKVQQAEELKKIETVVQELKSSLALETQRAKDLEDELIRESREVKRSAKILAETMEQAATKDDFIRVLEDKLDVKSQSMKSLKIEIESLESKVKDLRVQLSNRAEQLQNVQKEKEAVLTENCVLKATYENAVKENKDLMAKSSFNEEKVKNLEEHLSIETKKNKEYTIQMEQLEKDTLKQKMKFEELMSNFEKLQSEKADTQKELESRFAKAKATEASERKVLKLEKALKKLEEENKHLKNEANIVDHKIQSKCQQTESMQKKMEENFECLEQKITEKEKQIKAVEGKFHAFRKKFELKIKALDEYKKENKLLKKDISKEITKSSHLESVINKFEKESKEFDLVKDEEYKKLLNDLGSKSTLTAKLEDEVQRLKLTAAEAIKNKEDAEIRCQHKIADMVALMEKHKNQYDRLVEEKDAELEKDKKKEMETAAHIKSLELDLSKQKADNDQLKGQLRREEMDKINLQKEVKDLKKVRSSTQVSQQSHETDDKGSVVTTPDGRSMRTYTFSFSKTRKTPSNHNEVFPNKLTKTPHGPSSRTEKHILEDAITPESKTKILGEKSKIRSYRIKTPPLHKVTGPLMKSVIELDPKSDSSDDIKILSCKTRPESRAFHPQSSSLFKKIMSPSCSNSPENLKMAAMKRMRDAGWTAVTGCDKKKRKTNEKIFA